MIGPVGDGAEYVEVPASGAGPIPPIPSKARQSPPPVYQAAGSGSGPEGEGAPFVPGTREVQGPIIPSPVPKPPGKGKGKKEAGKASLPAGPARPGGDAPMDGEEGSILE